MPPKQPGQKSRELVYIIFDTQERSVYAVAGSMYQAKLYRDSCPSKFIIIRKRISEGTRPD